MMPVKPHLISECLSELNYKKVLIWPSINEDYLKTNEFNIVVQVNGKKRTLIKTKSEINEKDLIKEINQEGFIIFVFVIVEILERHHLLS